MDGDIVHFRFDVCERFFDRICPFRSSFYNINAEDRDICGKLHVKLFTIFGRNDQNKLAHVVTIEEFFGRV